MYIYVIKNGRLVRLINTILNSISVILDFLSSIGSLLLTLVNLLPSPFNVIFNSYFAVGIALYLWKVYKGG